MGGGVSSHFFNSIHRRIMGRNPIWLLLVFTTLVWVFEWVGLYTNLGKTKSIACTPGFVWGQLENYTYERRSTG